MKKKLRPIRLFDQLLRTKSAQPLLLMAAVLSLSSLLTFGQSAPSGYVIGSTTPVKTDYSISGYEVGTYPAGTNFHLYFGRNSTTESTGENRIVQSFVVDGRTYVKGEQGATPFSKVVLKRIDNANVTGDKATAFFESQNTLEGTNVFLRPAYTNTMEELINSYVFNRGADNVFSQSGNTQNNVERIDLIFEQGITAPEISGLLNRSGILLMERGGNDAFKFAAIKSLTPGSDRQVASFGELKTAPNSSSTWGGTGTSFSSIVLQRNGGESGNMKPSQVIESQQVSGTFITLASLGIGVNETFYGISLFANDVTSVGDGSNLVTLSEGFPTNSDGTSQGGLDFMAGGGFFTANNTISGRVFHDAAPSDSDISSHTGGQDGSLITGLELYVSLVSSDGSTVLATVPVNDNGSYSFYDVGDGNYSVVLHNNPAGSTTSDLGPWFPTGEGANSTKDGTSDGRISLAVPAASGNSLTQTNFGINRVFSVSGTVYNDANGADTGGIDDGTPTNAGGLYALLVDAEGKVVASDEVATNGIYEFSGVQAGPYTVVLYKTDVAPGEDAPTENLLPNGWAPTGEDAGSGVDDEANSQLAIEVNADLSGVNFGIQQPPVAAQPVPETIPQPNTGAVYTIAQPLSGTDPEDAPVDPYENPALRIIGGTFTYPEGDIPDADAVWFYDEDGDGEPDESEIISQTDGVTISNFDYTKLKVKLNGQGYTGTGFSFSIIDAAGAESQPETYALSWGSPLPVKLISFKVNAENAVMHLNWETSEETNSDRFEIERSTNIKTWNKIGEKASAGTSNGVLKYTFDDTEPVSGANYYRLKMIDKDQTFTYSSIVSSRFAGEKVQITVYPNPVVDVLYMKDIVIDNIQSVSVIDLNGKTVIETKHINRSGLPVNVLNPGIYVVRIVEKNGTIRNSKITIAK